MKKGSALLIVLGMLAFMVISAVAFSAFMRHSRLPSSFLLRASSSRLLVKAALAESIDLVDAAIGNDRCTGLGIAGGSYRYPHAGKDSRVGQHNFWRERCFIGTNDLISAGNTVSTLTVEGLAYLPPPLINDARYYSRRSPSAVWHTLPYEAGRFAFSAYDVTDCLDLNKLFADYGRDSSDRGRISLSYALENESHTGYLVNTGDWDQFMEKFRNGDTGAPEPDKLPLVSVADFNLALGATTLGTMVSPFCRFIRNGTAFVQDESGADADMQRRMWFVADSWFPQTNRTGTAAVDLSIPAQQPFAVYASEDREDENELPPDRFMSAGGPQFPPTERIQLYDYLDRDSVPTTLALPTLERTPMGTGVAFAGNPLSVSMEAADPYSSEEFQQNKGTYRYSVTCYKLRLVGNPKLMVGLVYPFKYRRADSPRQFKVQACLNVAFVETAAAKDLPLRQDYQADGGNWPAVAQWNLGGPKSCSPMYVDGHGTGFSLLSEEKTVSEPSSVLSEDEARLQDLSLDFTLPTAEDACILPKDGLPETHPGVKAEKCTCRSLQLEKKTVDQNGNETWVAEGAPVWEYGGNPMNASLNGLVTPEDGKSYSPTLQVWVRIRNADDKVVDQFPAGIFDDAQPSQILRGFTQLTRRPYLQFHDSAAGAEIKFANNAFSGRGDLAVAPACYVVPDPRFNYAPENFVALDNGGTLRDKWDEVVHDTAICDLRDDIFMATSDAGYLQSPYEFAFLLRIAGLTTLGQGSQAFGDLGITKYDGVRRDKGKALADRELMWDTYLPYGDDRDDFSLLNMQTGSRGFRMTPYASSTETMMSVVANTPLDWWVASTNDQPDAYGNVKQKILDGVDAASKYTFTQFGDEAKVNWDRLSEVADAIRSRCRGSDLSWEAAYDTMAWVDDDENKLLGIDMGVPLHSVDRKYLHGFWKECLSNRQQLFLIFVRAEPMMMGGGAQGQTPPQLGARAVALVWRDPAPTLSDDDGSPRPHRTRILFYRQLD